MIVLIIGTGYQSSHVDIDFYIHCKIRVCKIITWAFPSFARWWSILIWNDCRDFALFRQCCYKKLSGQIKQDDRENLKKNSTIVAIGIFWEFGLAVKSNERKRERDREKGADITALTSQRIAPASPLGSQYKKKSYTLR